MNKVWHIGRPYRFVTLRTELPRNFGEIHNFLHIDRSGCAVNLRWAILFLTRLTDFQVHRDMSARGSTLLST